MNKHLKLGLLLLLCQAYTFGTFAQKQDWYQKAINTSKSQLKQAVKIYDPYNNPRSIEPDGSVRLAHKRDWTCGFFPGTLWYMYELTGEKWLKNEATRFTEALDSVQNFKYTHDVGFMLYCSYGNGLRLTGNEKYQEVLINGAESLSSRFNPQVGCLRSWDFGDWQFPVIIDNMMNLELMMWASKTSKNTKYKNIAVSHANTTMENHFRSDYSSYHVVSYDTLTGKAIQHQTFQGYADNSSWARGQAWGVYGYTMMYRTTGNPKYLNQAKDIAHLIMNHPRLPKDKVPYWDYDAPEADFICRDASAAAITACALFELSTYEKEGSKYFSFAEDILKSLSSDDYLAKVGDNANFLLMHSVGSLPNNSEVDVPINYADYYYLEAMIKYRALKENKHVILTEK